MAGQDTLEHVPDPKPLVQESSLEGGSAPGSVEGPSVNSVLTPRDSVESVDAAITPDAKRLVEEGTTRGQAPSEDASSVNSADASPRSTKRLPRGDDVNTEGAQSMKKDAEAASTQTAPVVSSSATVPTPPTAPSTSATPAPGMPAFAPFPAFAPVNQIQQGMGTSGQASQPGSLNQMGQINPLTQLSQLHQLSQLNQLSQLSQLTQLSQMGQMGPLGSLNPAMPMSPFPSFFAPFTQPGQSGQQPVGQPGSQQPASQPAGQHPTGQQSADQQNESNPKQRSGSEGSEGPQVPEQPDQQGQPSQQGQQNQQQPMYYFVPVPSGIREAPVMYQCVQLPPGSSGPPQTAQGVAMPPPMGPMGPSMMPLMPQDANANSKLQQPGAMQAGDTEAPGMKSIAATLAQMRDGDKQRVVSVDVSAPRSFLTAQRTYGNAAGTLRPHTCNMRDSWGRQCKRTFTRPYDLLRHQETVHSVGTKVYICERCGAGSKRFSRQDSLARHIRRMHHAEPERRTSRDTPSYEVPASYFMSPATGGGETPSEDENPAGVRQVSVKPDKQDNAAGAKRPSESEVSGTSEQKKIKLDDQVLLHHRMESLTEPQAV